MTRRKLLAAFLLVLGPVVSFPTETQAQEKTGPLQVTYYFLPG
jgi:hypothetical protein